MKKTKLTRSLLAACSIVALSAVMYGCTSDGDDPVAEPPPMDMDGDGDGVADADDAFDDDPTETADADMDGVGDNADAFPDDPTEWADTDGDGRGDNAHAPDRDGDGVADVADDFPDDPAETRDSDGDGVGNNADAFPFDGTETADTDGDGVGDNADAFDDDATETVDSDGDGVGDNADWRPDDPMESADTDGDGVGDNADAFPNDAMETVDSDGDGVGDNADADAAELLADTKQEAADAAGAAAMASTAASAAVEAQRANKDLSTIAADAFARAELHARAAAAASGEAAEANNAAKQTDDQAEATKYKDMAEAAQNSAELARANAMSWAGMVASVKQMIDDNADNEMRLGAAQEAAKMASEAARMTANDAQDAANAAKAANPGSSDAMDAQDAADAADAAADEAKTAYENALADTDADDAEGEQMTAMTQQGEAAKQLMYAEASRDEAEDARLAATTEAIGAAGREAQGYATQAASHHTEAQKQVDAAERAVLRAQRALDKARKARTDADAAGDDVQAAKEAREAAKTARNDAYNGMMAAQTAATAAVNAETVVDAETQRDNARDEKINSGMADIEALKQAGLASDAADDAETAADTHVLRLFTMANAMHVMASDDDLPNTPSNESTTEANEAQDMLRSRNKRAINTAISSTVNDTDDAPNAAGTTASDAVIAWPADTPDDPNAEGDQSMEGSLTIQLSVGGNTITVDAGDFDDVDTVEREDPRDEESDPLPDDEQVDERNARSFDVGLGAFGTGYQMSATDADRMTEVLIFTDKKQTTAAITAISEVEVTNAAITTADEITKMGAKSGGRYTGVEFDHDDQDDGPPLMGFISCPTDVACEITIVDGEVTEIEGYTFTGSRPGVEGVDENPMNDYLSFGVWLSYSGVADDDDQDGAIPAERYTFGAFADGGTPADQAALTAAEGTATYRGSATGVHSRASKVDYFYGNATLTADFDDYEVIGHISNIYAGGVSVGHDIVLDLVAEGISNVTDGTASGGARMGTGRTGDDGNQHYPFEGSWTASFYNPVADVVATTTVNEAETAPGAAAGTFGVGSTAQGITESFVGAFGAHKD